MIIWSLATDKNGNIYAASNDGIIYKCLTKQTNFIEKWKTNNKVYSLAIDKDDNIYAGCKDGNIYKCQVDQTNFTPMTGANGIIWSLATDPTGNIYAQGQIKLKGIVVFKCEKIISHNWPIGNFNINCKYQKKDKTSWSGSLIFNDYEIHSIIRYDKYAENWNDFINNYGYSKLYLKGLDIWACCKKTFGCTSKNYPDLTKFYNDYVFDLSKISENNNEDNPYWIKLYYVYSYKFSSYETKCSAYLGFFLKNKSLAVMISTKNYLWSAGAYSRNLKVNIKLDTAYFIPNHI